jgi:hypothetical protein
VLLDTPRGDLIEVASSSYDLSPFSLKAGSPPIEGVRAAPGESSSVSNGELWPGIDLLDESGLMGISTILTQGQHLVLAWTPKD